MLPTALDKSRPLSLYIHVPFCKRKCDYCAFYSVPTCEVDKKDIERYVSLILSEINAIASEWGRPFKTIFVGGGNPGMLGYTNLGKILSAASQNGLSEECTIEINPENLTEEIESLKPYLTRISVGIQSMDEKALAILGRNGSVEENERALSLLSSASFDFNADIMTAIPGISVETTLSDIRKTAKYNPGHISLYCLTFEENTPLIERAKPIGDEMEAEVLKSAWAELSDLGYSHYEVSNFAKEGKECIHNLVYWNLGQYIGIGPGAESSIGYRNVVSMRENETLYEYLKCPEFTCMNLSEEEAEEEFLLTTLRTRRGIVKEEYRERFMKNFDDIYGEKIAKLDCKAYINTQKSFSLTEEGFMILDRIILEMVMAL